jgi:hypothetical protein
VNKPTLAVCLGLSLFGFAVAPLCYWWQGYLGTFVWGWFAVAIFGARPIATWQAAGVITLLHFFLPTQIRDAKDKERGWPEVVVEAFVHGFLIPLLAFGSSAFIHWMVVRNA